MPIIDDAVLPIEDDRTFCAICLELSDIQNFDVASLCLQCRKAYCKNHTSKVDRDYCDSCLRPHHVATQDQEIIDEDGVQHEGRKINLTGEFWMSMVKDICRMTDDELIAHIASLRSAVREIEVIRDYRKIALAHGENELEERRVGKLRRLRLVKDVRDGRLTSQQVVEMKKRAKNATGQKRGPSVDINSLIETLKAAGVTREQMAGLIAKAQGKK